MAKGGDSSAAVLVHFIPAEYNCAIDYEDLFAMMDRLNQEADGSSAGPMRQAGLCAFQAV